MRNLFVTGIISLMAGSLSSAAEIQVTFNNGAARTLPELRIENGAIRMTEGRFDASAILSVQFTSGVPSEKNLQVLFDEGRYSEITDGLTDVRSSLLAAARLPGNGSVLLRWFLKASFWQADYETVTSAARSLNDPAAQLYVVLALIEQGRPDESEVLLSALETSRDVPPVMLAYVRARLAFSREQYKEALQYIAQVEVLHSRDREWDPAARFLEGMIYVKTGRAQAAADVAEELMLGWPDSLWSRRAAELKESGTEGNTP